MTGMLIAERGANEIQIGKAICGARSRLSGWRGHRHAFGRAKPVARGRRDDPLLAGQQRDLPFALHGDDAVVDLAGKQAQREADDARRMAAHPFDREVGLPRIGRPEDCTDRSV